MIAMVLLLALAGCSPAPARPAATQTAQAPEEDERRHPPAMPVGVELTSRPGEAGVREFVSAFLEARVAGDAPRARDFLSPTALDQFAQGDGGLTLTGTPGPRFARWEFAAPDAADAVTAADASSWEVRVRIHTAETQGEKSSACEEILFVGPGPDASGIQRPWIVRGARRSS